MTKVKQLAYSNRYTLFFFLFLIVYSILDYDNLFSRVDTGLTYSIYAVDFSFGFCTRLLPGAVFNLLFDDISVNKVSLYMLVLLFFCFACVSFFAGSLTSSFEKRNRSNGIIFSLFAVVTFFICFSAGDFYEILDFHWLIGMMLFFLLLKSNITCLAMPILFIGVIMCHYGSMICYIPMFIIILMLKAVYAKKKERVMLICIITISVLAAIALFVYMLMFELENLNYSLEEFNAVLSSRGVTDFEYYNFPFFRETADISKLTGNGDLAPLVQVDMNQPKIIVMLQTVINQIQVHIALWNHTDLIFFAITFLPMLVFSYSILARAVKKVKAEKKLIFVAVMLLPVFTVLLGLFMSTDTLRWFSHGMMVFVASFGYIIYKDAEIKDRACCAVEKISKSFVNGYLLIYVSYLFVFL